MRLAVLTLAILLLTATSVRVYAIRHRIARGDADPAAVAELEERVTSLPSELAGGAYIGRPEPVSKEVIETSGADCYASSVYTAANGDQFRVYVGGAIRNQENFHAPGYCMPAQGWEMLEQTTEPFVAYPVATEGARMRRLLLQRGSNRMLVYYWFQAGRNLADHEWEVRYYRFLDLLADRDLVPTVIVTIYIPIREGIEESEQGAHEFLRAIGPSLEYVFTAGDR